MSVAAAALAIAGAALAVWGARAAVSGERPIDLLGALAAAGGVTVAAVGVAGLVAPGFLG